MFQFAKFPILSVASSLCRTGLVSGPAERASCLRSRAHANTSRYGEIPAGEFMRLKSAVKNVRARARAALVKIRYPNNAVTITSIRFSRASDSFYFLPVLSVPRLFARRYDRIEFKNAVSTGKYVSLKPSDSDLWTRMKSSMDHSVEETTCGFRLL